jgi:[NiFe] hydrogenase assembly HybE family chaperone
LAETLEKQQQERIDRLVARFTLIGEQRMRDLPVYNPALSVEATGFQPLGNDCIGVLITPWFMNLVLLPADARALTASTGAKVSRELASGAQDFMIGEDEELGRYAFISLASPMFAFENQATARRAARAGLDRFVAPRQAEPSDKAAEHTLHFTPAADMQRRAFLRGRLRGAS